MWGARPSFTDQGNHPTLHDHSPSVRQGAPTPTACAAGFTLRVIAWAEKLLQMPFSLDVLLFRKFLFATWWLLKGTDSNEQ